MTARSTLLKPDVVALGEGVLGAVPDSWALFSGTSAATAQVSGLAALLRADHDWSAPVVRSVLTTTARPLAGAPTLPQGAGQVGRDAEAGLALDVRTTAIARPSTTVVARPERLLDRDARRRYDHPARHQPRHPCGVLLRRRRVGFARHRVLMTPLALRLAPGETATVRITITGPAGPTRLDDGWIVWRGARGSETRVPVAITR